MRAISVVGATLLMTSCAAGPAPATGTRNAASCVGPQLTLSKGTARPGDSITVIGHFFASSCPDTFEGGKPTPTWKPRVSMTIQVVQNAHTWIVDRMVDAEGVHASFVRTVILPTDLRDGAASISVPGSGLPATLVIRR